MTESKVVIAVPASQNKKTGTVAATYAPQQSCPQSCPHLRQGTCYASFGQVGLHWRRITKAAERWLRAAFAFSARSPADPVVQRLQRLEIAREEARQIDALAVAAPGIPLRLHVAGDCATPRAARIVAAAVARWQARGGGPAWTYTHAWRRTRPSDWGPVSVLASVETADEARAARARGWALAWTVASHAPEDLEVAAGAGQPVPCPEQSHGIPCDQCRLCFDAQGLRERGRSIAFAAHGTRRGPLAQRLRA